MPKLTAPPQKIPDEILKNQSLIGFIRELLQSVYQIFYAVGGKDGNPTINIRTSEDPGGVTGYTTITGDTDTPTVNPGWATSSTINMTAPDGYIKAYVGTQAVTIPYWNT